MFLSPFLFLYLAWQSRWIRTIDPRYTPCPRPSHLGEFDLPSSFRSLPRSSVMPCFRFLFLFFLNLSRLIIVFRFPFYSHHTRVEVFFFFKAFRILCFSYLVSYIPDWVLLWQSISDFECSSHFSHS